MGQTIELPGQPYNSLLSTYKFKQGSPLKTYLHFKMQEKYKKHSTFTLRHLLGDLKYILKKEKLYDPLNPAIILCDARLERVLDIKALHVSEVKEHVLTHLVLVYTSFHTRKQPIQIQTRNTKQLRLSKENEELKRLVNLQVQQTFNKDSDYRMKPLLKATLKQLPHFPSHKRTFNYTELCQYLTKYIICHKEKLIDPRHIKICIVRNDPLGKAFNVNAFHRCQVAQLLRRSIIPLD
jgi:hypothetical protein